MAEDGFMEHISVWFLTDNEEGKTLAEAIRGMGLEVNLVEGISFDSASINIAEINIFIIDLDGRKPAEIVRDCEKWTTLSGHVKFVLLKKREITEITRTPLNMTHLEFISKPVDKREFLLLLEKTIIVERYRELMKYISLEAEERIEVYEELMDINRKDIFSSDVEKKAFEKIVRYEKGLMREQIRLNEAIKEFTVLRQNEMMDMESRIRAEEMLSELRRKEMLDARQTIEAQESVIDFSSLQLDEAKRILDASEQVAELSRVEAIQLHEELAKERDVNRRLSAEMQKLQHEIEELKKKQK